MRQHLDAHGPAEDYRSGWRDAAFIEYYYVADNDKCMNNCTQSKCKYPEGDCDCTDLPDHEHCWSPICNLVCYPTESLANNFIGDRNAGGTGLSGGERRRAALATVLVAPSPTLLLDEPLSGLEDGAAAKRL